MGCLCKVSIADEARPTASGEVERPRMKPLAILLRRPPNELLGQVEFGASRCSVAPRAPVRPRERQRAIRQDDHRLRALNISSPVEQRIEKFPTATRSRLKGRDVQAGGLGMAPADPIIPRSNDPP